VVKYIYKDILFLWDRDFHQTNGLFVEKTRNLAALGAEHMKVAEGAGGASMNKRTRDPLLHKDVLISSGYWKGHKGKVCQIDDR
jgi:transcription elongation factor